MAALKKPELYVHVSARKMMLSLVITYPCVLERWSRIKNTASSGPLRDVEMYRYLVDGVHDRSRWSKEIVETIIDADYEGGCHYMHRNAPRRV